MLLNENKYNTLFVNKFKANETQLKSEFKRIIDQQGNTDEVILDFYKSLFKTLITQYKKDLPKDENYNHIITTLYNYFIRTLKEDYLDTTNFETELELFRNGELPKNNLIHTAGSNSVPEYKAFNTNTKYGRRKAREQAIRSYENGTPEYRKEIDKIKTVVFLIVIVIAIVLLLIKTMSNTN